MIDTEYIRILCIFPEALQPQCASEYHIGFVMPMEPHSIQPEDGIGVIYTCPACKRVMHFWSDAEYRLHTRTIVSSWRNCGA